MIRGGGGVGRFDGSPNSKLPWIRQLSYPAGCWLKGYHSSYLGRNLQAQPKDNVVCECRRMRCLTLYSGTYNAQDSPKGMRVINSYRCVGLRETEKRVQFQNVKITANYVTIIGLRQYIFL